MIYRGITKIRWERGRSPLGIVRTLLDGEAGIRPWRVPATWSIRTSVEVVMRRKCDYSCGERNSCNSARMPPTAVELTPDQAEHFFVSLRVDVTQDNDVAIPPGAMTKHRSQYADSAHVSISPDLMTALMLAQAV